jgi:2-polyprenyl-3-methyl-5-hydroxy-6-metoxy-1,4-benzoquinol methylase
MTSDPILRHYDAVEEASRLDAGRGRLERMRTQELLERFLPAAPATVLDVGGAAGVYSSWLAERDYRVHLVDLSPKHVEEALGVAASLPHPFTAEVGDVRSLPADDASYDAVLLLGPLYHLQDRDDRLQAWREASRVVRPGGFVVAALISRFASMLDGLRAGYAFDDRFAQLMWRDVETGCHDNPDEIEHWFTTAYFHHPDEIQPEVADSGLHHQATLGIEGPAAFVIPDLTEAMDDPAQREVVLASARAVETEPTLMSSSSHLFVVARAAA